MGGDHRGQGAERPAPVADRVLGFRSEFRGRQRAAVGNEDRIVAKAVGPARLAGQRPGEDARHRPLVPRLAVAIGRQRERRDADELGAAGADVAELAKHEAQVGLIVAVPARPAGREHARHAVQRVHAQARVVGDRGQAGIGGDGTGLEQRVVGKREAGLGDVGRAGERLEADQAVGEAFGVQDAGKLGDLAGVTRRKHQARGARRCRISH